jgi:hypothetical protein
MTLHTTQHTRIPLQRLLPVTLVFVCPIEPEFALCSSSWASSSCLALVIALLLLSTPRVLCRNDALGCGCRPRIKPALRTTHPQIRIQNT